MTSPVLGSGDTSVNKMENFSPFTELIFLWVLGNSQGNSRPLLSAILDVNGRDFFFFFWHIMFRQDLLTNATWI